MCVCSRVLLEVVVHSNNTIKRALRLTNGWTSVFCLMHFMHVSLCLSVFFYLSLSLSPFLCIVRCTLFLFQTVCFKLPLYAHASGPFALNTCTQSNTLIAHSFASIHDTRTHFLPNKIYLYSNALSKSDTLCKCVWERVRAVVVYFCGLLLHSCPHCVDTVSSFLPPLFSLAKQTAMWKNNNNAMTKNRKYYRFHSNQFNLARQELFLLCSHRVIPFAKWDNHTHTHTHTH